MNSFGGNISVESEVGEGTCFTVILPLHCPTKVSKLEKNPADRTTPRGESSRVQLQFDIQQRYLTLLSNKKSDQTPPNERPSKTGSEIILAEGMFRISLLIDLYCLHR